MRSGANYKQDVSREREGYISSLAHGQMYILYNKYYEILQIILIKRIKYTKSIDKD